MKKWIKGILVGSSAMLMGLGLAACNKDSDESSKPNSDIYAVYQSYVAYAEENSADVMTYEQWLETIKGPQGPQGSQGAQGVQGPQGPQGQQGQQGEQGKSAYEIAVENGFDGTEEEWLASLKGEQGQQGVQGSQGSQGEQGEKGEKGEQGQQGQQGAQGVGIVDIDIAYGKDEKGNDVIIYTFHMSDDTTITKTVKVPKKVMDVMGLVEGRFVIGKKPELKLWVRYTDGSEGEIDITEDMIVYTNLDYNTKGTYFVEVKLDSWQVGYDVTIYDPANPEITGTHLECGNLLWTVEEYQNGTVNLSVVCIVEEYDNGTQRRLPVTFDMLNVTGDSGRVDVNIDGVDGYFTAYICNELSEANFMGAELYSNTIYCEVGKTVDLSNVVISAEYILNDNERYFYFKSVTIDMLNGFDNMQCGHQYVMISAFDGQFNSGMSIIVYADSRIGYYANISGNDAFRVVSSGIPEIYFNVYKSTEYLDSDSNPVGGNSELYAENIRLTSDMVVNSVDFSKVGVYTLEVNYNGSTGRFYIELYDPEITNIRSIDMGESFDSFDLPQGTDIEEFVNNQIIGKSLRVYYYEPVDGETQATVTVTKDMVDSSKVDTATPGFYVIVISYMGKEFWSEINIAVDLTDVEMLYELNCSGYAEVAWLFSELICNIKLYENGYAVLTDDDSNDSLWETPATYTIEGNLLTIKINGENIFLFNVDLENNTFERFDFSDMEVVASYSCADEDYSLERIDTYANGYALVYYDYDESLVCMLGYTLDEENKILTIMPSAFGYVFKIGENNSLIFIEHF